MWRFVSTETETTMDMEKLARDSGMQVVLDGRIGREEYKSVYGSLQALQRFADSVREFVASESCLDAQSVE
jgi:methyl coenzyme M reductase gamma subunit